MQNHLNIKDILIYYECGAISMQLNSKLFKPCVDGKISFTKALFQLWDLQETRFPIAGLKGIRLKKFHLTELKLDLKVSQNPKRNHTVVVDRSSWMYFL